MEAKFLFAVSEIQARINEAVEAHAEGKMSFDGLMGALHHESEALIAVATSGQIAVATARR